MSRSSALFVIVSSALLAGCATSSSLDSAPTIDIARVQIQPKAEVRVPPEYPTHLRNAGRQGEATVDFVVGTDGRVHRVSVIKTTDEAFGRAAVAAVEQWRFRPARVGGEAVNCHMQVPIVFTLNEERRSYDEVRTAQVLPETATIYTLAEVSTQPRATFRQPPAYPFELRRVGAQGEAVISFVVAEDGTVANARIERSTHPAFGEAALACIQNWKFVPATRKGRPVSVQMQVPIVFTLNR